MNLLLSIGGIVGIVVAAVVVLAIIIWAIATRNSFVSMQNQCEGSFHNIDIYLKKRYDLLPNMVNTVKGYAKYEGETLQSVIAARSKAQSATTPAEKIEANAELTQSIRNFNAVVERYPELKANTNFLDLQNQLKNIEGELANVRKYYNACVLQFNKKIGYFPANIIAGAMHLKKQPYFELDDVEERKNVKVEF